MIKTNIQMPTEEQILKYIDCNKTNIDRMLTMQEYYEGKHKILLRTVKDSTQGNNKLINNYPSYITDVLTGFFMGKPIAYVSTDESLMEKLEEVLNYNDEGSQNYELSKSGSIKGTSYEILYTEKDTLSEKLMIRFGEIEPENVILAYDNSISPEPQWAIRYYIVEDMMYVELYTKTHIYKYSAEHKKDTSLVNCDRDKETSALIGGANFANMTLVATEEHYFDGVPIVEYPNNQERQGDFERVKSLIDSYDLIQSNTANLFQYNDQALLKLVNYSGTTREEIKEMKDSGAIKVETGGDVDWIIKNVNDVAMENHKTNLRHDIHKFSKTPDLSDENFSGDLSGVAIEFKLWATEQHVVAKERAFKKALQRRMELMCNFWRYQGSSFDWRKVKMTFTRNMPVNVPDAVGVAIKMTALTSKRTALSYLPMIDNVNEEMELIEQEQAGMIPLLDEVGEEDGINTERERTRQVDKQKDELDAEGT